MILENIMEMKTKRKYHAPSAAAIEVFTESIICDSNVWAVSNPFSASAPVDTDFGRSDYGNIESF